MSWAVRAARDMFPRARTASHDATLDTPRIRTQRHVTATTNTLLISNCTYLWQQYKTVMNILWTSRFLSEMIMCYKSFWHITQIHNVMTIQECLQNDLDQQIRRKISEPLEDIDSNHLKLNNYMYYLVISNNAHVAGFLLHDWGSSGNSYTFFIKDNSALGNLCCRVLYKHTWNGYKTQNNFCGSHKVVPCGLWTHNT